MATLSKPSQTLGASQHLAHCAGIVVLASVIMLPVFVRGFPAGFDAVRHYRWTSQFIDALRDGSLYPRWLPTANDGQGSPVPLYYPPLPFYVAAAFSLISANTLQAISLSCWLALVLSGIAMYALSRSVMPGALSFAAAALYMLAPYHLLDLYQGATPSEFWTFAWIPLMLDSTFRVTSGAGSRRVIYLALSYALLVLTHVPVAFLVTFAVAIYGLALTRKLRALVRAAAGLTLGAGIAAIFLVPVIFETRYVWLFFKFDYRDYFLFEHLHAAFTSTRFQAPSLSSYTLDVDLVAVGLLALFLPSSLLMAMKWNHKQDTERARASRAIWVTTSLSFLMTTRLTALIWLVVPGLTFLFFPYRWLAVVTAGACFLAALSVWTAMRDGEWRLLKEGALLVAVILNIGISAAVIWRAPYDPKGLEGGLSRRDVREYRPVWWDGQLRKELWQGSAHVENGDCDVHALDDAGIKQSYSITASSESVITLRPLYFPGWVARVDGKQIDESPSATGNIQLTIEPGEHTLTLSFEDTWPRTLGKFVSAVSLLASLAILYAERRGVS